MPNLMAQLTLPAETTWNDGRDDLDGALDYEGEPEKDGFDNTKDVLDAAFDGAVDIDG